MNQFVLILGATSAIAKGCMKAFAKRGYSLYLAGKNEEELKRLTADFTLRYPIQVKFGTFDATHLEASVEFIKKVGLECSENQTSLIGVLLAVGDLGEQGEAILNYRSAAKIIQYNLTAPIVLLTECANYLQRQRGGFIIGISSVAGDRGRKSNYIYGAAKGGLSLFLQGLRNRLYQSQVHVLTVKPGFVDTAMTFGLPNLFLVASPDDVGEKIVQGLEKKKNILYVPGFWRFIMMIIKMIPETLFKRLNL